MENKLKSVDAVLKGSVVNHDSISSFPAPPVNAYDVGVNSYEVHHELIDINTIPVCLDF